MFKSDSYGVLDYDAGYETNSFIDDREAPSYDEFSDSDYDSIEANEELLSESAL
jgi:hypothetical protein